MSVERLASEAAHALGDAGAQVLNEMQSSEFINLPESDQADPGPLSQLPVSLPLLSDLSQFNHGLSDFQNSSSASNTANAMPSLSSMSLIPPLNSQTHSDAPPPLSRAAAPNLSASLLASLSSHSSQALNNLASVVASMANVPSSISNLALSGSHSNVVDLTGSLAQIQNPGFSFNLPPTIPLPVYNPTPGYSNPNKRRAKTYTAAQLAKETFSDISEDEDLLAYILKPEEVVLKEQVWTTLNADYIAKQAEKAALAAIEAEKGPKVKKVYKKRKADGTAESAQEAVSILAKQKKVIQSAKINYENLFSETDPGPTRVAPTVVENVNTLNIRPSYLATKRLSSLSGRALNGGVDRLKRSGGVVRVETVPQPNPDPVATIAEDQANFQRSLEMCVEEELPEPEEEEEEDAVHRIEFKKMKKMMGFVENDIELEQEDYE